MALHILVFNCPSNTGMAAGTGFFFLYVTPLQKEDDADDDITIFPVPD